MEKAEWRERREVKERGTVGGVKFKSKRSAGVSDTDTNDPTRSVTLSLSQTQYYLEPCLSLLLPSPTL